MHTDPIADMLNRVKNSLRARRDSVEVSYSKHKGDLAKLMKRHGFLLDFSTKNEGIHKMLVLELNSEHRAIEVKRRSKPGQRIYLGYKEIRKNTIGHGLTIISTSKGLKSAAQAIREKVGGEIICEMH